MPQANWTGIIEIEKKTNKSSALVKNNHWFIVQFEIIEQKTAQSRERITINTIIGCHIDLLMLIFFSEVKRIDNGNSNKKNQFIYTMRQSLNLILNNIILHKH